MGLKGDMGEGAIAFALNLYEEIAEYGFIWDVKERKKAPPPPELKPVTGPDEIRIVSPKTWGWTNMQVDKNLALTVPIFYPIPRKADGMSWTITIGSSSWKHGPGGDHNEVAAGVPRYPFNDRGALGNQLIFKFGAGGTPQPVWNEYSWKNANDRGTLYLRSNLPDSMIRGIDTAERYQDWVEVIVAYNPKTHAHIIANVESLKGWQEFGVQRYQGQSLLDAATNPSELSEYVALPVPAVKNRGSLFYSIGCGPEGMLGDDAVDDQNYPYHGPGAKRGQLLYKYGENGTALPLLSGDYIKTLTDTGNLFLNINVQVQDEYWSGGHGGMSGYAKVRVS
ncbi:hypothetical protein SAMN04489798_1435 [Pseudomonas arsenicoxydans]|uniref:Uncharacterized protein n=1 Tax=Pseudomonas arsenicoxydans TaxID=702115 RepID=A0A1H0F374_9PSED|nr:hypothetical protein [Pseudomonas arsenicoxydans]SDN88979.1 hypothetical protein SAMN04489798_1435 [Pseudomonas arsenicoxydans]